MWMTSDTRHIQNENITFDASEFPDNCKINLFANSYGGFKLENFLKHSNVIHDYLPKQK